MPEAVLDTADLGTFLRRICAEPEDGLHRLVFADWLADRDDDRAEAVRASESPLGVLTALYPPREVALEDCPTFDRGNVGARSVRFTGHLDLFSVSRPFLRLNPPKGHAIRLGELQAVVGGGLVGIEVRVGVVARADGIVLAGDAVLYSYLIEPYGCFSWNPAFSGAASEQSVEFWASGSGPNHLALSARAEAVDMR